MVFDKKNISHYLNLPKSCGEVRIRTFVRIDSLVFQIATFGKLQNVNGNFNLALKKLTDITLNILTPLIIGTSIYFTNLGQLVRDFVPDGLWAYSLVNSILIVWDRQMNALWLALIAGSLIVFESLQAIHIICGTGDLKDIIVYFIFGLIALILNKSFMQITTITKN